MGSKRRAQPKRMALKLSQIRRSLDLSQEQMARRLEDKQTPVYPTHVSEFERGLREPSLLVLLRYARIAGVIVDVLIDDEMDLPDVLPPVTEVEGIMPRKLAGKRH